MFFRAGGTPSPGSTPARSEAAMTHARNLAIGNDTALAAGQEKLILA